MAKNVVSVGIDIPGGEVENIDLSARRSLLDHDIIIFKPGFPSYYSYDNYQGKPCLSDGDSLVAKESISHWRREISAAYQAGKIIVVLLESPKAIFVATGEVNYSGTGRNSRATRIVTEINSYSALPVNWKFHESSGKAMVYSGNNKLISSYWKDMSDYSIYKVYIEGEINNQLLKTKSGNRIVSSFLSKDSGLLIFVPMLDWSGCNFYEYRTVKGEKKAFWSDEATIFGRRFVSALISLSDVAAAETASTPVPGWATADRFRMRDETRISALIEEKTQQIGRMEEERSELGDELRKAGSLRSLLFENGKPLEAAVIIALRVIGFEASEFHAGDSQFDVVFSSAEGRFIGEVEGKDSKAINIDKFSQLERNLSEDFSRDEVVSYAKGVLFGNAFRLAEPDNRSSFFTEKCLLAASRIGAALVSTVDLFKAAQYLKNNDDEFFATRCREAISSSSGAVVIFPEIPTEGYATEIVNSAGEID